MESWTADATELLVTRESNLSRLSERLNSHPLIVTERLAGKYAEVRTRIASPLLKKLIYSFNHFWIGCLQVSHLAQSNTHILRKAS